MICGNCLTVARPRKARPGSGPVLGMIICGVVGLVVWPMLLVAGVFFLAAVARAITHAAGGQDSLECGTCRARGLVPLTSPGGQNLLTKAQEAADRAHVR